MSTAFHESEREEELGTWLVLPRERKQASNQMAHTQRDP